MASYYENRHTRSLFDSTKVSLDSFYPVSYFSLFILVLNPTAAQEKLTLDTPMQKKIATKHTHVKSCIHLSEPVCRRLWREPEDICE